VWPSTVPIPDSSGVIRYGGRRVILTEAQTRIMMLLLSRFESVVHRDEIAQAGWPGSTVSSAGLTTMMQRLRARVAPLGFRIATIRARGYLLTFEPEAQPADLHKVQFIERSQG
jgi:DNA-binding winged helix-turn-helix (wHTH) protein